ncbi:MAG: Protein of unknown function periplasmic [Parcubacteria group bacterium]|nr:Protein of unknown function periplasmic [Parcubacteria group bacterium]
MKMPIKVIGLIVAVVVIALVVLKGQSAPTMSQTAEPIASVLYSCNAGKGLAVQFFKGADKPAASADQPPTPGGTAKVSLSDGREFNLTQTISADGGRYTNSDESFVFWGKGNTALVLENNTEKTYIGCILVAPAAANFTEIYSNSGDGFSIRTPKGYTIDAAYQYQFGEKKTIAGVKFTVPSAVAAGTNLGSNSYISVESIPQAKDCSATAFLPSAASKGSSVYSLPDGNFTYSVATSSGAGAGNRYDELVFAIPGTNPCIAVRYWVHYSVFENYPAGTVKRFDEVALLNEFDTIRRSLVIAQ